MAAPTPGEDMVTVARADLAVLLDPLAVPFNGSPGWPDVVARLRAELDKPAPMEPTPPVRPPWSALGLRLAEYRAFDARLDLQQRSELDQLQAFLRAQFAMVDVDLTDGPVTFVALLTLIMLSHKAKTDHDAGLITDEEMAYLIGATINAGAALARWVPTGGPPS